MNSSSLELLKELRLGAMAAELKKQMEDSSAYANLGFEERFGLMADAEWNRRQANKLTRFVHNAKLSLPNAVVEDIEYFEDRHLDKAQLLRLSTCKYIDDGHHIILRGASGNGKTSLPVLLGTRRAANFRWSAMPECRNCSMN